jgi:hypothetical protein
MSRRAAPKANAAVRRTEACVALRRAAPKANAAMRRTEAIQ